MTFEAVIHHSIISVYVYNLYQRTRKALRSSTSKDLRNFWNVIPEESNVFNLLLQWIQ